MSNPVHVSEAIIGAMLKQTAPSIDYTGRVDAPLVSAIHRACNDLEGQGPRSARVALQLLEALARYEFEVALEEALRSDLDLQPYAETLEETEELPIEMAQKLAEKKR